MQEAVAMLFTFCLVAAVLVLILYFRHRRQREILEAQRDLQTRILERFDSSHEFSSFLQTQGGQRFLSGLTDSRGWRPARRIMLAVQIGLVIAFFGLGLVVMGSFHPDRDIMDPAILVLFIGAGFLAAAAASYVMSKRWRLLPGDDEPAFVPQPESYAPAPTPERYAAEPHTPAQPTPGYEPDGEA